MNIQGNILLPVILGIAGVVAIVVASVIVMRRRKK